jgi:hypothetical protein
MKKNRQAETQFKPMGDKAHDEQPLCVKVPEELASVIRGLPNRSAWLRRVITEAAQRELMNKESKTK